jgi:hypothetical protein
VSKLEELSILKNKFYLVDLDIQEGKQDEFHTYWANQMEERRANGAEHMGSWSVIAGEESPKHIQSLFQIHNFNAWINSEIHKYDTEEWPQLVKSHRISILHLEADDHFQNFLERGAGRYYYWEDIELKAHMQNDYLADLKKPNSKMNADLAGECVATFTVLAGTVSTVHIKRLCAVKDPATWFEDKTHRYHSDFWEYLALWSKITLVESLPYSRI